VTGDLEHKITCHFCFEEFEIDIEIHKDFTGHNTEIYDCVVCCNPNKGIVRRNRLLTASHP